METMQENPIAPEKKPDSSPPVRIIELAGLPKDALVNEAALAEMLSVTPRTVRRMVARFELPPAIRMAGRAVWIAGRILAHINERAKRAEIEAEKAETRVKLAVRTATNS